MARFALSRRTLFRLDDVRFKRIMSLTEDNLEIGLQYPQVHQFLLNAVINHNLSLPRFDRLSSLILDHALPLKREYFGMVRPFIIKLERVMPKLIELNDDIFNWVMDFSKNSLATYLDYPVVHDALLNYAFDQSQTLESIKRLGALLNHAVGLKRTYAEIEMDHLLAGVGRYRGKDEAVLEEALRLLQASDNSLQPLFDNAAETLVHLTPLVLKNKIRDVMVLFYQVAKLTKGEVTAMLAHPDVRKLFAFSPNESDEIRDKRIIWMHLLHNQVFVMENVNPSDKQAYIWDHEHNNDLAQAGFAQYTRHMTAVLKKVQVATDINHTRDLTVKQQRQLLQLTSEMKVIGTRLPEARREPDNQWKDLSVKLHHLAGQYQATWFKSLDRRFIASQLTNYVDHLMKTDKADGLDDSRYHLVLTELYQAKVQIIERDIERNNSRWSWLKFNRSGQSRLYNTINQMQDEVLRHWGQDIGDVRALPSYKTFHRQEFISLTKCLQKAVTAHWEEVRYVSNDNRYNSLSRRIGNFMTRDETKNAYERLMRVVDRFVSDNPIPSGDFSSDDSERYALEIEALLEELRQDLSRMPGHIATLAKEVLVRGDSLVTDLQQQRDYGEIRKTAE